MQPLGNCHKRASRLWWKETKKQNGKTFKVLKDTETNDALEHVTSCGRSNFQSKIERNLNLRHPQQSYRSHPKAGSCGSGIQICPPPNIPEHGRWNLLHGAFWFRFVFVHFYQKVVVVVVVG